MILLSQNNAILGETKTDIKRLEGTGACGPLLLAPAESLGAPCHVGVIYYGNNFQFVLHDAQNAMIKK